MAAALKNEARLVPITALHFLRLDKVYLLSGEGSFLQAIERENGRLVFQIRLFEDSVIHGITSCSPKEDGLSSYIFVYGEQSARVLYLDSEPNGVSLTFLSNELKARDWILHAEVGAPPFVDMDHHEGLQAAFVTAHNDIYLVHAKDHLYTHRKRDWSFSLLTRGPRTFLYSAHLIWIHEPTIMVAAGSATGEVIVWTCDSIGNARSAMSSTVVGRFTGHEGAVFGVRLAENFQGFAQPGSRLLVSCSDDRTIRVWSVPDSSTANDKEQAIYCVAKVMGHASRIWSASFLSSDLSHLSIISAGEDGTARIWKTFIKGPLEDFRDSSATASPLHSYRTYVHHSGKNIWSTATLREPHAWAIATGGADSRIASFLVPKADELPGVINTEPGLSQMLNLNAEDQTFAIRRKPPKRKLGHDIFRGMLGTWNISRTVESKNQWLPSGTFEGEATLQIRNPTPDGFDAEALYVEQGQFVAYSGLTFPARRSYLYRYQDPTEEITDWFVKPDDESADCLFHTLNIEIGGLDRIAGHERRDSLEIHATAHHLCVKDMYDTEYIFHLSSQGISSWSVKHTVLGPRKDYVATAEYTRLNATNDLSSNVLALNSVSNDLSHKDQFKAYAWVSRSELLVTTVQGSVLLGKFLDSNDHMISEKSSTIDDVMKWAIVGKKDSLRSATLISCISELPIAYVAGLDGIIYIIDRQANSLERFYDFQGKLPKLNYMRLHEIPALRVPNGVDTDRRSPLLEAKSLGSGCAYLIPTKSTCPLDDETIIQSNTNGPHRNFIATCSTLNWEGNIFFEGSRHGGLRISNLHVGDERCRHLDLHHGNAITVTMLLPVKVDKDAILFMTAGRDGQYAFHKLRHHMENIELAKLQTLHQGSAPFGAQIEGAYVEKCGDIVLWGFDGICFVVWNVTKHIQLMKVECGGSHREWAFQYNEEIQSGNLAWTKASTCHIYRSLGPSQKLIQDGGHGRELKDLAISPIVDINEQGERARLVATCAEDTTVRLFSIDGQQFRCMTVMSEHTTGVRKLAWSPNGKWLFSAAGCSELFVWRYEKVGCYHCTICVAKTPSSGADQDVRVMDINVSWFKEYSGSEGRWREEYTINAVYSDSAIRSWKFVSEADGPETDRCSISRIADAGYRGSCLTQVSSLAIHGEKYMCVGATDGKICVLNLDSEGSIRDADHQVRVTAHTNTIQSLAAIELNAAETSKDCVFISGGDDQALCLIRVSRGQSADTALDHNSSDTLSVPNAHGAAITDMKILSTADSLRSFFLVTVGIDQRLKVWKIELDLEQSGISGFSIALIREEKISVADASSVDAYEDESGAWKVVVGGIGLECWTFSG